MNLSCYVNKWVLTSIQDLKQTMFEGQDDEKSDSRNVCQGFYFKSGRN